MTLREALDRSPANDRGDREIVGQSDVGGEFVAVEMKDGTISFWLTCGVGEAAKWPFDEPQEVEWRLKETGCEWEVEDYYVRNASS